MNWDQATQEKFRLLLDKMPVFMRGIAEKKVSEKAEDFARRDNRGEVSEKDMVDAFFEETPFGFQGLMKNDLNEFGIDYVKYGYSR
ncbi:MAG: PCP reductase family protein [Candidatus Omnitrophica bacterium]|nr:PCP reductase family protein [Candidatus Omnitrophota bacterium]MDD5574365.1 PCP reductase family protein [Candidatus Omnitrophota bacterium]